MEDHSTIRNNDTPLRKRRRRIRRESLTAYEVTGQLSARSHILHTDPRSILFEVCSKNSVELLINHQHELFKVSNGLQIGKFYRFDNLATETLRLTEGTHACYVFTDKTTCSEVEAQTQVCHPLSLRDFVNVEGVVTKIDKDFGICYFKNSEAVLVSTCSRIAQHVMPKVGHFIRLYNAHRVALGDGTVFYVLCAKSYLKIIAEKDPDFQRTQPFRRIAEEELGSPAINLSPLLLSLGKSLRDFRLILWLQTCSSTLEKSLNDDFLQSLGVLLQNCVKQRAIVLQNLADHAISRINCPGSPIVEEFVAAEHNLCCGTLKSDMVPDPLFSLSDVGKEFPPLDIEHEGDGTDFIWNYDVKRDQRSFLVGVVSVRSASHRISLCDASASMACVILPTKGQSTVVENLSDINQSLALVLNYDVIREKFWWVKDDMEKNQGYRYLSFYFNKTIKIPLLSRKTADKTPTNFIQDGCRGTCDTSSNSSKSIARVNKCISLSKGVPLQHYFSQYILVLNKSAFMIPEKKPYPRGLLIVRTLSNMVSHPANHQPQGSQSADSKIILCLETSLLGIHPLISINSVYEIRLPPEHKNLFQRGCTLRCVEGLKSTLPTVEAVTVPSTCEFIFVQDFPVPNNIPILKDIYGIEEAVKDAKPKELLNIIGYVFDLYHQEPRYEREMSAPKVNSFGIPGEKVIAVILSDTLHGSQPATLYMTYWNTLQYPLGLVPGAKVIFRNVFKVIPVKGSKAKGTYFRASVMSSVDILDLPIDEIEKNGSVQKLIWGPRSLLSNQGTGCQWISCSMVRLKNMILRAKCVLCDNAVRNGKCEYVGCSSSDYTVYSQASISVNECKSASPIIFVPNALVPKLFNSEKLWENVVAMVMVMGELHFSQFSSIEVSRDWVRLQ